MNQTSEERRRYPRSRRSVCLIEDHAGPGVLNHIDNISANGVLCHPVKPVPLMTKLSIVFDIPAPAHHRVECEGVVVRCDPHEKGDDHFKVAIIYTHIGEEALDAIQAFVGHDLSQPATDD